MWELDCEESWALKNLCCWTVVLEKILESPLDWKEIQPVHSGDQPWAFFGRNDTKAETPVLWPPDVKSWLTGKDSDGGRDWGWEEKGTTEDEMAGWHHWLDKRESEWTLRVGDGQGGLACCDSWGCKELDKTEWLNWTDRIKSNLLQDYMYLTLSLANITLPFTYFISFVGFFFFFLQDNTSNDYLTTIYWQILWPGTFLGTTLRIWAELASHFQRLHVSHKTYRPSKYMIPISSHANRIMTPQRHPYPNPRTCVYIRSHGKDELTLHWRRKWQPTPVFLPGESQGRGSLLGCRLWGRTESDTTEVT